MRLGGGRCDEAASNGPGMQGLDVVVQEAVLWEGARSRHYSRVTVSETECRETTSSDGDDTRGQRRHSCH